MSQKNFRSAKRRKANSLNIFVLAIHNILRWVVVAFALVNIILIYTGFIRKKSWTENVNRISTFYTISLDIQLLVGLLQYFIFSSLIKAVFADFSAAMDIETLRFFGVEHVLTMIFAIVFAHLGNSVGKKELVDSAKYKQAIIYFTISVIFLLAGIPWTSRPLLPAF